jgi:hypothetical protein
MYFTVCRYFKFTAWYLPPTYIAQHVNSNISYMNYTTHSILHTGTKAFIIHVQSINQTSFLESYPISYRYLSKTKYHKWREMSIHPASHSSSSSHSHNSHNKTHYFSKNHENKKQEKHMLVCKDNNSNR